MRKLSISEAQEMMSQHGRGGSSRVMLAEIRRLNVGDSLLIEQTDWKTKSQPVNIIAGSIRDGKKFSTMSVGKLGWIITRIK